MDNDDITQVDIRGAKDSDEKELIKSIQRLRSMRRKVRILQQIQGFETFYFCIKGCKNVAI